MAESRKFRLLQPALVLLVLSCLCLLAPPVIEGQSSGPTVNECSSEVVDPTYDVEETVCLSGDASGVTASAEVDNYDTSGYVAGVDADVNVYNGSSFLYDTGDVQSSGSAYADYTFIPVINAIYTANSFYGECGDNTYSWDYGNCYWSGDSGGPSTQAQVTPSVSLSTSSPAAANGAPVTFTASVTGGLTGTITFYDGSVAIGTGTISGSDATLSTSSLAIGFHNVTANWPGNGTYGPLTSNVVVQTVYQPGPIQIPAQGVIATVAGNGIESYAGDGGDAMAAEVDLPKGITADSEGNLYVADTFNNRVRKVTASTGIIATVAGNGTAGYSGDGGAATNAELFHPYSVAVDVSGNIYIADPGNNRIREVNASSGNIATVAGNGTGGYSGDGGAAVNAELNYPIGVALDNSGNVYIADESNNRIRKITISTGIITTVAGDGTYGYSGDGGPAINAELNSPFGVALDSSGNVYIADQENKRIRKVTISTGIISTVAGTGTFGYSGDGGAATSAEITYPLGLSVDSSNNVYFIDFDNERLRKITASTGVITTVAGNGTQGYTGDGGPAVNAELDYPAAVAVDGLGNLYIVDSYNNRIRAVGEGKSTPVVNLSANPTSIPSLCSGTMAQFTASLTGGNNPSGTVSFQVDGSAFGTVTLSGGSATYSGTNECWAAGTHTVTAEYSGDSNNNSATSGGVAITVVPSVYDTGTVSLTVAGQTLATVTYGQASTTSSVAEALAAAASNSNFTVNASDDELYVQASSNYAGTDYSYSVTSQDTGGFGQPSFSASPASGNLQGAAGAGGYTGTVYSYSVGYDAVGNVSSYSDTSYNGSVMGAWSFGYDSLNRLTSGSSPSGSSGPYAGLQASWTYDSFGNRTTESFTGTLSNPGIAPPIPGNSSATYNTNNQIQSADPTPVPTYDQAGDVTEDSQNQYLFDGAGRICASYNMVSHVMTGYLYDADGNRVAKGSITSWSCDPSTNGFQAVDESVLGPSGEQVSELGVQASGSVIWEHTNVWAVSALIATYDPNGLHFYLNDPLGTRRAQTDSSGVPEQICESLPFGNGETCTPYPTEHLFTGKERDDESGNDYFGARYYASNVGRFLTPDWSAKPKTVPYANFSNPQSFNLYDYVLNNPFMYVDPNGHSDKGLLCFDSSTQDNSGNIIITHLCFQLRNLRNDDTVKITRNISLPTAPLKVQNGKIIFDLPQKAPDKIPQPINLEYPDWNCAEFALKNGVVATGLDAVGLIPVEATMFKAGQAAAAVASGAIAEANQDKVGAATAGAAIPLSASDAAFTGAKESGVVLSGAAKDAAEAVPVLGQVVSGIAVGNDLYNMAGDYQDCTSETN